MEKAVFTINGKVHKVYDEVPVYTSLNTYIRDRAHLKGTKFMCKRGTCGSCMVNLKYIHPWTKKRISIAVHSCLMPVLAAHGCAVTTIEGIGSRFKGYHPIQEKLADSNGTQCGFCSPGFVMNMFSLLEGNPGLNKKDVEDSFNGNICRCTGYRPILDAFKSFAKDDCIGDIEDSNDHCWLKKIDSSVIDSICTDEISIVDTDEFDFVEIALAERTLNSSNWYKVSSLKEVFEIFDRIKNKTYHLIGGNTSTGIIKQVTIRDVYIDITQIPQLRKVTQSRSVVTLGTGVTLTETIQAMKESAKLNPKGFNYMLGLIAHLEKVANVPVRNRATLGGNLIFSKENRDFVSDVVLILEAVSAKVTLESRSGVKNAVLPLQLFNMDTNKKVITEVKFQPLDDYIYRSYKIMQVAQNSTAIVNSAFVIKLKNRIVTTKPNLVYSGIDTNFSHASKTEYYLLGKDLTSMVTLKGALNSLSEEIKPNNAPLSFSPAYRKLLSLALFYKMFLSINETKVSNRLKSGGKELVRPLSSGKQNYTTDRSMWPVSQPMPKLEAKIQCAGEADYVNDLHPVPGELYGYLVLATQFGDIKSIDASKALAVKGVIAFYSVKDIPGKNNVMVPPNGVFSLAEVPKDSSMKLFCDNSVEYVGQPVGILVAESYDLAKQSSSLVTVTYVNKKVPLLTVRDVLNSKQTKKITERGSIKPVSPSGKIDFNIEGEFEIGGQYAYTMENQVTRVVPEEDGQFYIYASTQWIHMSQTGISQVTNIPMKKLTVTEKRVGGSYGFKCMGNLMNACACALASMKLNRAVRVIGSMEIDMLSIGKRAPVYVQYKVGVDNKGVIQKMEMKMYEDFGVGKLIPYYNMVPKIIQSYYDTSKWDFTVYSVATDTPISVGLRGLGSFESFTVIETVMDHIAYETKLDVFQVRINNSIDELATKYIQEWRVSTEFNKRKIEVENFNNNNRWKKRGISMSAMKFGIIYAMTRIGVTVSILVPDGTVQVQHGGIEMGQGVNTKVAVVCAHTLSIGLDQIQIKSKDSVTFPNDHNDAASVGSSLAAYHAIKCCEILNERLKPIRESMENPTWVELINKALDNEVVLTASIPNGISTKERTLKNYFVYGVTVAETELDVLTGERQILRVDILQDTGKSLSPEIDVGQVEGSFMFGVGALTSERLLYDKTGALINNDPNSYKVPTSKDIPIDFRVTFIKNSNNPSGIYNSKATGEPSIAMAVSVVNSFRNGLNSARKEAGISKWCKLDTPCTIESVLMNSGTSVEQFVM